MKRHVAKSKILKAGFTLIELLIAMSIVALLSASALRIARLSDTHKNLSLSTDQVKVAIRTAQSFALAMPRMEVSSSFSICGFGVYISSATEYQVFHNVSSNRDSCTSSADYRRYNIVTTLSDGKPVSRASAVYTLPLGVEFATSSVNSSIFFSVPYANVYDMSGNMIQGANTISLSFSNSDVTNTVNINAYGKID